MVTVAEGRRCREAEGTHGQRAISRLSDQQLQSCLTDYWSGVSEFREYFSFNKLLSKQQEDNQL